MSSLEIRLLGTVEIVRDGQRFPVSSRRVSALVILLALAAGRTVSVDALSAGIWDDDPPERVRGSLQTYVARLRRLVGDDRVHTEPGGYRLGVDRGEVDALCLLDLIEESRRAPDTVEEGRLLAEALALWRGTPFGQPPSDWIERHEAPPLVERHLLALERRIDLDLAAGDHTACVAELSRLVEAHPLRETLWARLLRALAGCGRQAEALTRYDGLRSLLAEELGSDPSLELQELHRELLAGSPPPRSGGSSGPPRQPAETVPRMLPPSIRGFTGRTTVLAELDATVAAEPRSAGPRVAALHGPAGVGKTSLALHWAHRSSEHFPDGQLFVNLRGYGPGEPVTPMAALDLLLRSLGLSGAAIPTDLDARSARWRDELAGRRLLVLLDNARDSEQLRPLLPGGESVLLVTTRSQLRSLAAREGIHRVPVPLMTSAESVALLRSRLPARPRAAPDDTDEDQLHELAELCGHLAVALSIAGERAGRDRDSPLGDVVARLRDSQDRLTALTAWEDDPLTDVRAVLDWSYELLDPDAATMLRRVGQHDDSSLCTGAAAALMGTTETHAERLLDRLTETHLLEEGRPGWYRVHDLVRVHAAQRSAEVDSAQARDAAVRRLRSWYVHSALAAREALRPPVTPFPADDPEPGVTPLECDGGQEALRWFSDHHSALMATSAAAIRDGDHRTAYLLAPTLSTYLTLIAWSDAPAFYTEAEAAARADGAVRSQGLCANVLGTFLGRMGDLDGGRECFLRALALYQRCGDRHGQLAARINLALALEGLGDPGEAIEVGERALAEAERLGAAGHHTNLLNNLATTYLRVDRPADALSAAERAVASLRAAPTRDPFGLAGATDTLGEALIRAGRPAEAVDTLREALQLHQRIGHSSNQAVTLKKLGLAQRQLGRPDEARAAWTRAAALLDGLGAADITEVSRRELDELVSELDASR